MKLLFWLFTFYISAECFAAFWRMDGGDKFCRLAKYLIALTVPIVGLVVVYIKPNCILGWWLLPDVAVALFLWPTTYARFTGGFKNRIGDK